MRPRQTLPKVVRPRPVVIARGVEPNGTANERNAIAREMRLEADMKLSQRKDRDQLELIDNDGPGLVE